MQTHANIHHEYHTHISTLCICAYTLYMCMHMTHIMQIYIMHHTFIPHIHIYIYVLSIPIEQLYVHINSYVPLACNTKIHIYLYLASIYLGFIVIVEMQGVNQQATNNLAKALVLASHRGVYK